jgi:FkbM family methyltransferase
MSLRTLARRALPPALVHRYRMLRHVTLFPCEPELRIIPRYLSRSTVAIDVGAHVGLYTDFLARLSSRVLAVEPHPNNAAHLRALGIKNCTVFETALSDKQGEESLVIPSFGGSLDTARATIDKGNALDGAEHATTLSVKVSTLDALCSALPPSERISFIKIDVEGHELEVIRGSLGTIREHRPTIMAEVEARHGSDVPAVFSTLRDFKYVACALVDGVMTDVTDAQLLALQSPERLARKLKYPRSTDYVCNVFFVPEGAR